MRNKEFIPFLLHILESFFLYNSCQQNFLFCGLSIVKYVLFQSLSHIIFPLLYFLIACYFCHASTFKSLGMTCTFN